MCVDRKVLRDPEGPTGERVRLAFTVGSPPVFLSAWLVTYLSVRAPPPPPTSFLLPFLLADGWP